MAEDERLLDDEVADAAVAVVVDVGAADADGGDADEDVARGDRGDRALLDRQVLGAEQDARALGVGGGAHADLASSTASSRSDVVWSVAVAPVVVAPVARSRLAGRGREGPVAEQVGEPELGGTAHQDVPPELGGHDAQPVGHRRHGLRPDVVLDAVPDVPEQHPEEPASTTTWGSTVWMAFRIAVASAVTCRSTTRRPRRAPRPAPWRGRRGRRAGAGHGGQGAARGLGLQAPDRPAVAADAVRRDEGVPELARVPVGTAERSAGADDPATDAARAAVQVHQVVDTARTAVEPLGPGAEVRVVRRADRSPRRSARGPAKGSSPPAEVRGVADDPVLDPDDARDGDADADEPQLRAARPVRTSSSRATASTATAALGTLGCGSTSRSRTVPSRATSATATVSISTVTAAATTSPDARTTALGRPTPAGRSAPAVPAAGNSSCTRPRSTSSPTRARPSTG